MMSSSLMLSNAVMNFYHLTKMNVFALDFSGTIQTMHAPLQIPGTMNEQAFSALLYFLSAEPDKCVFWHSGSIAYMGGKYDSSTVVIAGPFISPIFQEKPPSLNMHVLQSIPILNHSAQQSAAALLMNLSRMNQAETAAYYSTDTHSNTKILGEEEATASIINLRYRLSNEMMHAVETGDLNALKKTRQQAGSLFDSTSRFPNKPLRALKNNLIILNTIFRLAAERGGAPPVLLHQLSEKFALAIEQLNNLQSFKHLNETMGVEYCQAVLDNQLKNYSILIKRAIRYLHVHFAEPVDYAALAGELNIHPVHLSRQFKKETGKTMSRYVQELRLNEAKRLLKERPDPIEQIAGQCGFENAPYFSHVFKKATGMTPRQWRSS